jgi:hypothetical protein
MESNMRQYLELARMLVNLVKTKSLPDLALEEIGTALAQKRIKDGYLRLFWGT